MAGKVALHAKAEARREAKKGRRRLVNSGKRKNCERKSPKKVVA